MSKDARPVFLNLFRISQPIGSLVSIGHRITGFLLILLIPALLWLLQLSLSGPEGFDRSRAIVGGGPYRVLLWLLLWVFFHHLFTGIRHLALDLGIGVGRERYRATAWLVLVAGLLGAAVGTWLL